MFSWGTALNGELGQGGVEDADISRPSPVKFNPEKIERISPGGKHTLVLTSKGELFSCGSDEQGQLGREGSQTRFEQISGLSQYKIVDIASGANHSLAVDEWGSIFSWGCDEHGQLGQNQGSPQLRVPRLIKSLGTLRVTKVTAGMHHSAALTASGQLFTWGSNNKGQLGVGKNVDNSFSPALVDSLTGVPLAGVACGGYHTLVVTLSGAVFSFGSNNHGQLGLGDSDDRWLPVQVRTLRNQRIAHGGLAAGLEHSVALTLDGGVFTWGSSRYGQLGHGSQNKETLPKKILELMGTTISQIAAGDRHTLALVPSRDKLYAFGLAGSGQLGRGPAYKQNANLPQIVNGGSGSGDTSDFLSIRPGLIAAGGNTSWAVKIESTANPQLQLAAKPALSLLTKDQLDSIASVSENEMLDQDLLQELETIFSSLSCLNGSLLTVDHYGCRGSNHGVDLKAWENAFKTLTECKHDSVSSIVLSGLLSVLFKLVRSPPDVEALRFYLLFPLHPSMEDPGSIVEFRVGYADRILSLQGNASKVVEKWHVDAGIPFFRRLITLYKDAAIHYLEKWKSREITDEDLVSLAKILLMMSVLVRINLEQGLLVSYQMFYIEDLHTMIDLRMYYLKYRIDKLQGKDMTVGFQICNFPFLFDPTAKEILLRADQEFTQRMAQESDMKNAFIQMFTSGQAIINPFFHITVNRDSLVDSALMQLASCPRDLELKKPLKVTFLGEEAEDAGGVTKEFFLLLIKEILNPDYGMFREYEETRSIWFNPQSFEGLGHFHLIGVVCGLAIYNFTIINVPFPLILYYKLLGEKSRNDISDLAQLSPTTAKSLQALIDYTEDDIEDVFCLNFSISESIFGEVIQKPLKEGGEDIPVTQSNKREYVQLYVEYILDKSVHDQFEAFKSGFLRVVNKQVLQLFHPEELQSLVVGNENYDWKVLEENCEYKEGYSKDHPTIQHFWSAFKELSEEEKRKFLLFLTGSDRIPMRGMESLKIVIQRTMDTNYLPVAHTCFNLLDLPEYGTKEKLKYKLLQAIQCTKGFGLV